MIDVLVAGVIALVVLVGAYQLTNDAVAMGNQTYNHLIARVALLSLEGRWRGLAGSDRRRLLEGTSLCHARAKGFRSWCEELSAKFATRQRQSEACLRERAPGRLQAMIVWSEPGVPLPQCWQVTLHARRHEWQSG